MPIIVRGAEVEAKTISMGVTKQSLLSPENTGSDNVLLDLLTLEKEMALDSKHYQQY